MRILYVVCCCHAPWGSLTLREAYAQVALVVEDVGKSKRPAAVPTESLTAHWPFPQ